MGGTLTIIANRVAVRGLVDLTPAGVSGSADREVEAFTGGAGPYLFNAHVTGLFPVVAVNGVRIDLP